MNSAQYDMCWCMSLSLKLLVQFLNNFQGRGCFSQGAPITLKKKKPEGDRMAAQTAEVHCPLKEAQL